MNRTRIITIIDRESSTIGVHDPTLFKVGTHMDGPIVREHLAALLDLVDPII